MADYHPRSDCSSSDLTSNLRQFKTKKAPRSRSKSLIATRSPHKSQFSAWIECFNVEEDELSQQGKTQSQIDAEIIQEKLEQIQKDREEKLKQFQLEVSNRVKVVTRRKQQEELNRSIDEWNKESKVICQSASPKKIPSSARNTCTFRSSMSADKIKNIMTGEANVDASHTVDNFIKSNKQIEEKTHMIRNQTHLARAGLVSKKIEMADVTSLPGGFWGKDKDEIPTMNIPTRPNGEKSAQETGKEKRVKGEILNEMWTGFDVEQETRVTSNRRKTPSSEDIICEEREEPKRNTRKIRFQLPDKSKSTLLTDYEMKAKPVGDCVVKSKKENQNENSAPKKDSHNYWTCRKLFMDIEREKVRETLRRKKHKKHITRLKQEKENERDIVEKEVEVFNDYKIQDKDRIKEEKPREIQNKEKKDRNIQKIKEINRYIEALKNLLKQRMAGKDDKLLSICSCGNSLLETHPDTCANNCIFYKNPKEYARVLTSVLSTLDG